MTKADGQTTNLSLSLHNTANNRREAWLGPLDAVSHSDQAATAVAMPLADAGLASRGGRSTRMETSTADFRRKKHCRREKRMVSAGTCEQQ